MRALLEKDYVLLSLDSKKHKDGAAVIGKLRAGHQGVGIPWMVVLDGDGRELASGDGPKGNIGCPARTDEIAWFRGMLAKTRSRLQDAELDAIQRINETFAARWLGKQKQ
ncbi:MAG: hypothetical protein FJ265_08700 [Planctomycetes bacterium]|nr:hypothetical protein [Planctomycetota bacterium]